MTAIDAPWPAPAKLNLFLHITGRRADGYHDLQTVFQFLDYGDELQFRVRDDGHIRRLSGPEGVAPEQDLTVRAARLLQVETGYGLGVDIHLDKRLPLGGGLGGGSSDAATTLVALNALWGTGLSPDRLRALALRLGADVPVFVYGQAAWAEGVGECLQPVSLPEPWFVVVAPAVHVSTAELFSAPELTRNSTPLRIRGFLAGHGSNVFEPLVRARFPEVRAALDWLSGFGAARMTGTGACGFAAFANEAQARQVVAQAPVGWRVFAARGVNQSPLMRRLAAQPK